MDKGDVNLERQMVEGPSYNCTDVPNNSMNLKHYFQPSKNKQSYDIHRDEFPYAEYEINEGLREDEFISEEKPEDVIRIGFFGDSFIWGQYVNNSQLWTEKLEKRLNSLECEHDFQVINFGLNTYDGPYSVQFYKNRGQEYDLDYKFFVMKDDEIMEAMEILSPILDRTMQEYKNEHDLKKEPSLLYKRDLYYEALDEALTEYRNKIDRMDREKLLQQVYTPMNVLDDTVEDDRSVVIFTSLVSEDNNEVYRREAEKPQLQICIHESDGR